MTPNLRMKEKFIRFTLSTINITSSTLNKQIRPKDENNQTNEDTSNSFKRRLTLPLANLNPNSHLAESSGVSPNDSNFSRRSSVGPYDNGFPSRSRSCRIGVHDVSHWLSFSRGIVPGQEGSTKVSAPTADSHCQRAYCTACTSSCNKRVG